jgi:hypothetical protein
VEHGVDDGEDGAEGHGVTEGNGAGVADAMGDSATKFAGSMSVG